jgi:hypothetical protein
MRFPPSVERFLLREFSYGRDGQEVRPGLPGGRGVPGAQLRLTDVDGHRFACVATSTRGGLADGVLSLHVHIRDTRWTVDDELRDLWAALAAERPPVAAEDRSKPRAASSGSAAPPPTPRCRTLDSRVAARPQAPPWRGSGAIPNEPSARALILSVAGRGLGCRDDQAGGALTHPCRCRSARRCPRPVANLSRACKASTEADP